MELRPGYKQTEVGVIPEDWDIQRLDSLGSGAVPSIKAGPFGSSLTKDTYVPSGYKVYGQEQVIRGDYLYGDYFISASKFHDLESCLVSPGDILLSLVGTAGKLLVVPSDAPTGIINPRLIRLSLDKKRVCPQFFKELFETAPLQNLLARYAQGGTMGVLSAGMLRPVRIPLPPLPEQRAIATALNNVNALVGALIQLIAKKRDLKRAVMQQLFTGQTRLPGFSGDWECALIADVADVKTGPFGSSLHERDYVEDGTPIITVEHLGEFGVMHRSLPRVSDADRHRLRAYRLESGDIVFSRVGSVDRNALIREEEAGWLFSGRLLRVRPDKRKALAPYLSYKFRSESFKRKVRDVAVGQTMASLNTHILSRISFELPMLPEQAAIADVLSDMDAELVSLEVRLAKTRALKQGMMRELLTGRTRLI